MDSGSTKADWAMNPEDQSLLELFAREAEPQMALVVQRLLELEQAPDSQPLVDELLRALHSLKGAARVVGLDPIVRVVHAMEDCLALVRDRRLSVGSGEVDVLLRAADGIQAMARQAPRDLAAWLESHRSVVPDILESLAHLVAQVRDPLKVRKTSPPGAGAAEAGAAQPLMSAGTASMPASSSLPQPSSEPDPAGMAWSKRWEAERLNRLMTLAGQALSDARWLGPLVDKLQALRRRHAEGDRLLGQLRGAEPGTAPSPVPGLVEDLSKLWADCADSLGSCCEALREHDRRTAQWSHRLYLEVLLARVRPFAEAVRRLPRLVRDLARATGKEVRLAIEGQGTRIDCEILERVEQLLMHLVRNAVDHGCELPEERRRAGKPLPAVVRVEAGVEAHELWIRVADDGRGVDLARLRDCVVRSGRASAEALARMNEAALLEFLFEPGFSLKECVTSDSGRGVGLDVVREAVHAMRGRIQVFTQPGCGTCFELRLPLTLSVVRTLVVEVATEVYAFPLDQVERVTRVMPEDVDGLGEQPFVRVQGQTVALVSLESVLGLEPRLSSAGPWWAVMVRTAQGMYGWLVDRCLGERELLLQPLDPRLGRFPGLSGTAVLEDGRPVVVLAPLELAAATQGARNWRIEMRPARAAHPPAGQRRILAVDDSATAREMTRRLLTQRGYQADVAGDGWEAWQALHQHPYDLVLTDLEMPGLDGLELIRRIRRDPRLLHLPVILMTWRADEAGRRRGYEAGANVYVVKDGQVASMLMAAVERLLAPS